MAHALAANDGAGDFHTALLADDALEADTSVLPAIALEVLLRSEDSFIEQASAL